MEINCLLQNAAYWRISFIDHEVFCWWIMIHHLKPRFGLLIPCFVVLTGSSCISLCVGLNFLYRESQMRCFPVHMLHRGTFIVCWEQGCIWASDFHSWLLYWKKKTCLFSSYGCWIATVVYPLVFFNWGLQVGLNGCSIFLAYDLHKVRAAEYHLWRENAIAI